MNFKEIIAKHLSESMPQENKGEEPFVNLMISFLKTDPQYGTIIKDAWEWIDFPYKKDLADSEVPGIDIVVETNEGSFWAVRCKNSQWETSLSMKSLEHFLSTSNKKFTGLGGEKKKFELRLIISSTDNWSKETEDAIRGLDPPCKWITLVQLETAPVDWRKLDSGLYGPMARAYRKKPKTHHEEAVEAFHEYFKTKDRGKLILPRWTGKTYTALKIAENEIHGNGLVVYFAPSIASVGQALKEWRTESRAPLFSICVYSDNEISQELTKSQKDDSSYVDAQYLGIPASTSPELIAYQLKLAKRNNTGLLCAIFSTYDSLPIVAKAISDTGSKIDLIVCDEAHRTTGVMKAKDGNNFILVHDQKFLPAKKRLYMTATPIIYGEEVRTRRKEVSAVIYSMDDPEIYGAEVYRMDFSKAVKQNLISDYKVLLLMLKPTSVLSKTLKKMNEDGQNKFEENDLVKSIGSIFALCKMVYTKSGMLNDLDPVAMERAMAFCETINNSKTVAEIFKKFKDNVYDKLDPSERKKLVAVSANHVDGTMPAAIRNEKMSWLNNVPMKPTSSHILTNERCLSEVCNVPNLDAVIYMSQTNSDIELIQSVGLVMGKAMGKKYGYIIIPVVVPTDVVSAETFCNSGTFQVVWDVLNALKAHDDSFNAKINQIRFNETIPTDGGWLLIDSPCAEAIQFVRNAKSRRLFIPSVDEIKDYPDSIYAQLGKKMGSPRHMIPWAKSVGKLVKDYITKFQYLVQNPGKAHDEFQNFLNFLRENISPTLDQDDAISMLAQHMVIHPVYEAVFSHYSYLKSNPLLQSLQRVADILEKNTPDRYNKNVLIKSSTIDKFVIGIDNVRGRQKIIEELYNKFFKVLFKDMVDKRGIASTPVELADFIINSVSQILLREFERKISRKNIHIFDPFTGTGTYITRLLRSGLIDKSIERKYKNEIHANEILLLPYYIASINTENTYLSLTKKANIYIPFDGISLTDTFHEISLTDTSQLYGIASTIKFSNPYYPVWKNPEEITWENSSPIFVILGTPPFNIGEKTDNDIAQNVSHPPLEKRIAETYASTYSDQDTKNPLLDPYIKAFRWATEKIDENNPAAGIIAFITSADWIDDNALEGMRRSFAKEFTSIYVLNLRGNTEMTSDISLKKEGKNIFGLFSKRHIAITILVKNPLRAGSCHIFYSAVPYYMTKNDKLAFLKKSHDIYNDDLLWKEIIPNESAEWKIQTNSPWNHFISIADKKETDTFFTNDYFAGLKTAGDSLFYNFSKESLQENIAESISLSNDQMKQYIVAKEENPSLKVDKFITKPSKLLVSFRQRRSDLKDGKFYSLDKNYFFKALYRPFQKQICYLNPELNKSKYLSNHIFPKNQAQNLVICVSGPRSTGSFSTIMTDVIPSFDLLGNTQCFPLYYFEKFENKDIYRTKSAKVHVAYKTHKCITDYILNQCKSKYGLVYPRINKIDIFYYIYGLFHSPEYTSTFASDLTKTLPQIPLVLKVNDFREFVKAGKALSKLHLQYESVPPYSKVKIIWEKKTNLEVTKMSFGHKHGSVDDKSIIIYNYDIKITDIPLDAYNYVINDKSPIEWAMEGYQETIDKRTRITNDPNHYALEIENRRYILELILRLITVSLETQDIVKNLPKLDF
ncbi:MAG: DEAD/DEAH box helicase family protein [Deltaproteobacteria bacterium]|jgi:predicted helicase|nr:DEAD/DEAH box helicase family protein [Deltaproteobacteria bacterium]